MDSGEKMPYKAALALMDAAAMPIKPGKVWAVVSDDGKSLYLASPHNCTCKGAMYRPVQFSCYHQWVAAILARYDFPKPRLFVSDLKA